MGSPHEVLGVVWWACLVVVALVAAVLGVSVLVMVLLVVQMVGGVGEAAVVRGGGGWEGGPVPRRFVRVMWPSVDSAAFRGVVEGAAGVGRECCWRCSGG